MKVTITAIKLKSPWLFFRLSAQALGIVKQLKKSPCKAFRKRGFWRDHYTMSLWETEADLCAFAESGAHLAAMKQSGQLASEIRTITIDAQELPTWKVAKSHLASAKVLRYP